MIPFYTYFFCPLAKTGTVVFTDENCDTTKPRVIGKYGNREAANEAFDKHFMKAVRIAEVAGRAAPTKFTG